MTFVYHRFVAKSKTEPFDVKEYGFVWTFYATPYNKNTIGPLKTGAGTKSDQVGRPKDRERRDDRREAEGHRNSFCRQVRTHALVTLRILLE